MKNKINKNVKSLSIAFFITLFEFVLIYYLYGFNFEVYEVSINFATKGIIFDPNTSIQTNVHFGIITLINKLQNILQDVPVYGIYSLAILFIPFILINYTLINRIKYSKKIDQVILILFINSLLVDNLVNINNVRISIINICIFFILFIFSNKKKFDFLIFILFFIIGCLARIENGIIFILIGILYYIFFERKKHLYAYIITTSIVIIITTMFFIDFNKQNNFLKAAFYTDGRVFDNKYEFKEKNLNQDSLFSFQYAINNFIEDRDIIQPEDYFESLSSLYSYSAFKSNLKLMYVNNFKWITLLILICLLIFSFKKIDKKIYIFLFLMFLLPIILSIEKEVVGRFLIPYISMIILVLILTFHKNLKGFRLIQLFIIFLVFTNFQIKDLKNQSEIYNKKHIDFIKFNTILKQNYSENEIIVFSHILSEVYSPKLFYNSEKTQIYYLNFLWWNYYTTFQKNKQKIFKNPTCLLSNIEEISTNKNIIYLSDSIFTENFLINYMKYFHNSNITFEIKKNLEYNIKEYELKIYK